MAQGDTLQEEVRADPSRDTGWFDNSLSEQEQYRKPAGEQVERRNSPTPGQQLLTAKHKAFLTSTNGGVHEGGCTLEQANAATLLHSHP